MKMIFRSTACFLTAFLMPATVLLAQDMYVYPQQGQSNDQMEQDKFQCYQFGRDQTGFDPMQAPTATRPPPQEKQVTSTGRTVARGAAIGGAYGALTGNSSKARDKAKRGAATGLVVGGMRNSNARRENEANRKNWEQEQAANYQHNRNNYNRAYAACLEGRGYSVR
jgi:hypothetical protein